MLPLSATLITRNEEQNIEEALRSLSWVNEIVVVDSGSDDATVGICRKFTDRVYVRQWTGYVDQKNFAVAQARHDWILSLDADERVSPALAAEIQSLLGSTPARHGYRIPRVTFFMGRWIRHGDWYPDYQLRLFDRRRGRFEGGQVHESVRLPDDVGFLKGEIRHYTYRSLSAYLKRLEQYSTLAARDLQRKGKVATALKLLGDPPATFVRAFILKRGFLDGVPGLMAAFMGATSVFFKYAKLYELQQNSGRSAA
jgi:glycosyltransferase involved in cell wall biosynthesis